MKKIIHISDPHVGYVNDDWSCEQRFNNLARWMREQFVPANEYIIVITGDLVHDARSNPSMDELENYRKAKTAIDILTRSKEGKKGFKVLVVPGNHDFRIRDKSNKKRVSKVYDAHFREFFLGKYSDPYPKVDLIDGITFIGLNSMQKEMKQNYFVADGKLGRSQLILLKEALKEANHRGDRKVVYLHHHPFDPVFFHLQLKDSNRFKKSLRGMDVDVLLYGHNHLLTQFSYAAYVDHPEWEIPFCYDAGNSTLKMPLCRGYCIVIDLENNTVNAIKIKYNNNLIAI